MADLALGRGDHRGKARSLGAGWDAIKPTAQPGGECRERAYRQQQKCRNRSGGVDRFGSRHSGSSFGTAPLPWHQDWHDTRSIESRSPDDLLCNLRVSDQRGSRLPGAARPRGPSDARLPFSAAGLAGGSRLPQGLDALGKSAARSAPLLDRLGLASPRLHGLESPFGFSPLNVCCDSLILGWRLKDPNAVAVIARNLPQPVSPNMSDTLAPLRDD